MTISRTKNGSWKTKKNREQHLHRDNATREREGERKGNLTRVTYKRNIQVHDEKESTQ